MHARTCHSFIENFRCYQTPSGRISRGSAGSSPSPPAKKAIAQTTVQNHFPDLPPAKQEKLTEVIAKLPERVVHRALHQVAPDKFDRYGFPRPGSAPLTSQEQQKLYHRLNRALERREHLTHGRSTSATPSQEEWTDHFLQEKSLEPSGNKFDWKPSFQASRWSKQSACFSSLQPFQKIGPENLRAPSPRLKQDAKPHQSAAWTILSGAPGGKSLLNLIQNGIAPKALKQALDQFPPASLHRIIEEVAQQLGIDSKQARNFLQSLASLPHSVSLYAYLDRIRPLIADPSKLSELLQQLASGASPPSGAQTLSSLLNLLRGMLLSSGMLQGGAERSAATLLELSVLAGLLGALYGQRRFLKKRKLAHPSSNYGGTLRDPSSSSSHEPQEEKESP